MAAPLVQKAIDSDPEEDVAIATEAMAEGDLVHAMAHLAWALTAEPQRREWLDLFDEIIDAALDPLALAPMDQEPSFATVAARACIAARLGRTSEAIALLLRVYPVRPDIPYLEWAADWLSRPDRTEALDIGIVNGSLGHLLGAFPGIVVAGPDQRACLERLLPFALRLRDAHLAETVRTGILTDSNPAVLQRESTFYFLIGALLRKAGRLDDGLAVASQALDDLPCYGSALEGTPEHTPCCLSSASSW